MEEGRIDDSIERILVQLSFSNKRRIPSWLAEAERETADERVSRKKHLPGVQIIEETKRIDVSKLRFQLVSAWFIIVDAVAKPRRDARQPSKTYYMTRFIFERNPPSGNDYWLEMLRTQIPDALDGLCEDCWRVRAYRNTQPDGKPFISINLEFCEGRLPERLHAGRLTIEDQILRIAAK